MRADYKRFTGFWLLLTALGLAGLAGFNVLVDPAGAFPACHLKMFEPLRYLDSDRTAKAEMARRGDWQTIILGSSRSQIGFPARHPVLAHSHSCNLGLAAARFPEVVAAFDYAQQLNPLKQVILCLDLYMFCEGPRWIEDFAESRFNPDFDRFQYYCKQLMCPPTRWMWKSFIRARGGLSSSSGKPTWLRCWPKKGWKVRSGYGISPATPGRRPKRFRRPTT